jgi:hypothetical protein
MFKHARYQCADDITKAQKNPADYVIAHIHEVIGESDLGRLRDDGYK